MNMLKTALLALGTVVLAAGAAVAADTSAPTIIGGTQAPAGKWPFAVAIEFKDDGVYSASCGGSLIATNWVLTAAHCIADDNGNQVRFSTNTRVMVGSNDLTRGGRRIQASKVIMHPAYDAAATDYDIALIKLSKAVTDIEPVAFISNTTTEATYAKAGTTAWVVGWGDTDKSPSRDVFPTKLRQLSVPILSRSVCNGVNSYDGSLTVRMLCAGYLAGGKDSCQGDSGGPLIVKDADGVFALQAGVVSFGQGCAVRNFPGIYSRLAVLGSWVNQTMRTK